MMKVAIKKLKQNPFKKRINDGKLDDEQVERIRANLGELGFMGSIPVFLRGNQYYIIAGHHRVEALRREFGGDYEVDVDVKDYDDDQILRGMVIENLSQKNVNAYEVVENVALVREFLKEKTGKKPSSTEVDDWINKTGKVVRMVKHILSVYDHLHPQLYKNLALSSDDPNYLSIRLARSIILFPKNKQKKIFKSVKKSKDNRQETMRKLSRLRSAPSSVKNSFFSDELVLDDIEDEIQRKSYRDEVGISDEQEKQRLMMTAKDVFDKIMENFKKQRDFVFRFEMMVDDHKFFEKFNNLTEKQKKQFYDFFGKAVEESEKNYKNLLNAKKKLDNITQEKIEENNHDQTK